jgi:hypothetical protein
MPLPPQSETDNKQTVGEVKRQAIIHSYSQRLKFRPLEVQLNRSDFKSRSSISTLLRFSSKRSASDISLT